MAWDEFGQWYDDYNPEDDPGTGLSEFEEAHGGQFWNGDLSNVSAGDIDVYEAQGAQWPGPRPPSPPSPGASSGPQAVSGSDGGGGGGDGFSGDYLGGYGDDWMRATGLLGSAPQYAPPEIPTIDPFSYDPWAPPTFDSIKNDPTYLGRKQEGEQSLMNSRAAQGLARTGGTLKDLLMYNQDFAGREYDNIWNRGLGEYTTNRGNAFENWRANADTSLRRSGMEQDRSWNMFQPQFDEWAIKGNVGQRGAEFGSNMRRSAENDIFDRLRWLSEFELDAADR